MKRIFLDVGANTGQTLAAVQGLGFDRIHCFEPVPACWPYLEKLADKHTRIERFGLWNRPARMPIFDPGTKGGGLWVKDKRRKDTPITQELCEFRQASAWLRDHIPDGARVYMKLNCEGCECDILDDLLDSGEFEKVAHVMVDFDVRKIGALRHREAETRARLAGLDPHRVMYCSEVMVGDTHRARIRHWLGLLPA